MRYVVASVFMVFFGWLGTATLTDSLPKFEEGTYAEYAAMLQDAVGVATEQFGLAATGFGMMGVGVFLALCILMLSAET